MNEYRFLTPDIKVPKQWPVKGIENVITFLAQDAVNCYRSGQQFVMTVANIPTKIIDNEKKPGYVFQKIKEM